MLTKERIWEIAMQQSAWDVGGRREDFLADTPVTFEWRASDLRKCYYSEEIAADFVSFGNNIVASARAECMEIVREYVGKFPFCHCFETPNMFWLNDRMEKLGYRVCFMAEYFLPCPERLMPLPTVYQTKLLEPSDFADLYIPEFSNALCSDRREYDRIAVGAYDGEKLIGLAGASSDAAEMWQIGVDVLPAYRKKGIASALTSRLALEIINRGKVPFYCAAWSNIPSVKNALRSGFLPAWVELTVKTKAAVDSYNV